MRTETRPRSPQPQRQAHEVIAAASCRLAAARDRGEVYAAACDAALALLGPDPAAAAVLMVVSESGLTAIKTRGAFAGYETLTIAADALPERTRAALVDGQAVSVAGGLAAAGSATYSQWPLRSRQPSRSFANRSTCSSVRSASLWMPTRACGPKPSSKVRMTSSWSSNLTARFVRSM